MEYCSQQFLEYVRKLNSTVAIRTATADDAALFVSLFNAHYQRKKNNQYFYWQFFDSTIASKLFMAFMGGDLAACYGIKNVRLSSGIRAGLAVDFLVGKAYRKRGIPYLLENEIRKFATDTGLSVLMALPNKFGCAAFKKMGWRHIGTVKTLVASASHLNLLPPETAEALRPAQSFNYVVRDEAIRQYRFDQNPIYHYKRIALAPNVFAMVKKFWDPMLNKNFGDIVDFDGPSAIMHFSQIFLKASEILLQENCEHITTWALPHTPVYPILTALGFHETPQERYFCVKILEDKYNFLYDFSNWRLAQADSEIY